MLYKDLIKELEKFDKNTEFDSEYKFKKNILHYEQETPKYTNVAEMIHLLELVHPKGGLLKLIIMMSSYMLLV